MSRENTTLHSCAISDSLIRIDTLAGLLAKVLLEHALNLRDTSRTTNEDDIINIALLQLGVLEDLLYGFQGLLEQIIVQFFEFGPGQAL